MRNVSKEIFFNTLVCPTFGWLMRTKRDEITREPTLGEKFRIDQGIEIGKRARENGILTVYSFPKEILKLQQ